MYTVTCTTLTHTEIKLIDFCCSDCQKKKKLGYGSHMGKKVRFRPILPEVWRELKLQVLICIQSVEVRSNLAERMWSQFWTCILRIEVLIGSAVTDVNVDNGSEQPLKTQKKKKKKIKAQHIYSYSSIEVQEYYEWCRTVLQGRWDEVNVAFSFRDGFN